MPNYAFAKSAHFGQLFPGCGTREIAGANANNKEGAGDDATLVHGYNWSIVTHRDYSGKNAETSFSLTLSVPAYQPTISTILNVMSSGDEIEDLYINLVDRAPSGGVNKVLGEYHFENGYIDSVNTNVNNDDNNSGEMTITFTFHSLYHDNKQTNTSGGFDKSIQS